MSNDVSLDINQKSNPVQTVAPLKEDNNMLRATDKITALYCRLSVEDTKEKGGKDDPSNSIQHQYRKCKRKIVNQSAELTASAELYVMKPMNRNAILHFSGRNFAAGVIFSWIAA